MIRWYPRLAAQIAKQRFGSRIPTAHRTSPNISPRTVNYTPNLGQKLDFFRILLAFFKLTPTVASCHSPSNDLTRNSRPPSSNGA
jgi:hypothetical protein